MERIGRESSTMKGSFNPKNSVVGVLDDEQAVEAARRALERAGVPAADVMSYSGEDVIASHQAYEENKGLGAKLASVFPSQEDDLMKAYLSEAATGACLITVHAPDEASRDRAAEALRSVEARQLRHYAGMTIADLSKPQVIPPKQG